jgi:hypothetical protein
VVGELQMLRAGGRQWAAQLLRRDRAFLVALAYSHEET